MCNDYPSSARHVLLSTRDVPMPRVGKERRIRRVNRPQANCNTTPGIDSSSGRDFASVPTRVSAAPSSRRVVALSHSTSGADSLCAASAGASISRAETSTAWCDDLTCQKPPSNCSVTLRKRPNTPITGSLPVSVGLTVKLTCAAGSEKPAGVVRPSAVSRTAAPFGYRVAITNGTSEVSFARVPGAEVVSKDT
jgi:hypothetical protein